MADDLISSIEAAVKDAHLAGPSRKDIKSCILQFDGRPQICLSNVKSLAECNQIAADLTAEKRFGIVTARGSDTPCKSRVHTSLTTTSRAKRGRAR